MSRLHSSGPLGRVAVAAFLAFSLGWPLLQAADIQWTLDGDGSWHDAVNWSSNPALPGAADNVTINVGGGNVRVVTHAKNNDTIGALTNQESLRVTGGTLLVTGKLTSLAGSDLQAVGGGSSLEAAGAAEFNGASLFALQGGKLDLSTATSYVAAATFNTTLQAQHAGSHLDLSGLTAFAGSSGQVAQVFATGGGKVDLSSVAAINAGSTDIRADAPGSQIDLDSLIEFSSTGVGVSRLWATAGGSISSPNLSTVTDIDVRLDGATSHLDLAKMVNVDRTNISAVGGATLALPLVANYTGPAAYNGLFYAHGGGSSIDLSAVANFSGGKDRSARVFAENGGKVDLHNLPQIGGGDTDVRANGAGSVVDLTALTSWTDDGADISRLWAQNGGKVASPNLTSIVDVDIRLEGAGSQLDLGKLTNVDRTNVSAANGAQLALPLVTSYTGPTAYNGLFYASGANAVVDLTALNSYKGGAGRASRVFAENGGKVDLHNLPQISGGDTDVRANGAGSVVDLTALTSWTDDSGDISRLWAQNGGKVVSPNLTSIVDVDIRVEGAGSQLDLGKLTNVDRTNISAANGGQIALPLVTAYAGPAAYNGAFYATGTGSLLDLTATTSFTGGAGRSARVIAENGGKVDLRNLPQISGGDTDVRAEGPASVVDLSALAAWTDDGGDISRLWARGGGKVVSPNLAAIVDVEIRVEGADSHLDLGKLANVDRTVMSAFGGGQIALPLVTSYTGPTAFNGLFEATGPGSFIDLSAITSFTGGNGRNARVFAAAGGKVDLHNAPAIGGGAADLRSTGADSVLDISSLTSWTHTGGDASRWWIRDAGKSIVPASGIALTGVNMLVDGGGQIEGGPVTLQAGATLELAGEFNASLANAAGFIGSSAAIGVLQFGEDLSQETGGRLRVRFAGPGAGQFDTIAVAGQATLAGRLEVQLQNNFAPLELGDTIDLLTAAARTGNFEFGGALMASDVFATPVGVGNKVLLLGALAGDANLDGKIDLNDFGLLKSNFGSGQRLSQGNMNGDGMVDLNDFGILKANFGRNDGPKLSDLGAQAAPVPEPATGALLALGLVALSLGRLRRRRH